MHRKYKALAILVMILSFLSPNIVLIAQEEIIELPENPLTQEEIDTIIKEQEEREKNPPIQTPPLSEIPPLTGEEIDKLIQETKDTAAENTAYTNNLKQEGLTNASLGNCFDVYKFNNIDLSINLDQNEYEIGSESKPGAGLMSFVGSIKNNNSYPLPDLKIRGRIVKIEQEGDRRIVKTVEEIIIKENINLASKESQEINESYVLPIKATKGDYEILLTVVQNDQISIAGLSFTDDVYAFSPRFKIGGNNIEGITIDQKGITINDKEYNNLSFNPKYSGKKLITIKVPIKNNTDTDKEVEVEYEVYSWSDDTGKIKTETIQQKTIAKKGTSIATYTIEEQKEAVYYVKVKVKDNRTASNIIWGNIANIRFVNEDINEPRIAAVTMNTSPYSPEGELQLVTCIHNTNNSGVDTILENTIKDEKGNIVASSEYKGTVTGQVDGIYTKLPKGKTYNKLLVTSTIKDKDGNILNTVELNYDCQELDASKCKAEENNNNRILTIGGIIGLALLIIVGILFGYKRYRNSKLIQ